MGNFIKTQGAVFTTGYVRSTTSGRTEAADSNRESTWLAFEDLQIGVQ